MKMYLNNICVYIIQKEATPFQSVNINRTRRIKVKKYCYCAFSNLQPQYTYIIKIPTNTSHPHKNQPKKFINFCLHYSFYFGIMIHIYPFLSHRNLPRETELSSFRYILSSCALEVEIGKKRCQKKIQQKRPGISSFIVF